MKKVVGVFVFFLLCVGVLIYTYYQKAPLKSPLGKIQNIIKPLDKYTFDNLRKYSFEGSPITLGKVVKDTDTYVSQMFYYSANVALDGNRRKISGLINIPKTPGTYPVIVMFRGYAPLATYTSGTGTQHGGEYFAQNNFITVAPDFLGYGESDAASKNPWENRFQTYTTALEMLASVKNLSTALPVFNTGRVQADVNNIGMWGHSNGGHITLSVLAISGKPYPTVLWAPVSQSFPYSILYYTDEDDDQGKATRRTLATFEEQYNTDLYSPAKYYKWITAPLSIHQGMSDIEVPWFWTEGLADRLKKQGNDVTVFEYPGADHNLSPASLGWNSAALRSLQFYQKNLVSK